MRRKLGIAAAAAILLGVIGGSWLWWAPQAGKGGPGLRSGLVSSVTIGGPFTLQNGAGETVTDADFAGRHMLIYFGYTFCPDVCPTELGNIAVALNMLDDKDADQVAPVFITIDPERDTPELMADYVALFHERLVGLTGTRGQIDKVAQQYRIFFRKVEDPDYTYYLMDHSSFVYLMDDQGGLVSMFAYGTEPENLADTIRASVRGEQPGA